MRCRRVVVCSVLLALLASISLNADPLTFKSKRLTVLGTVTDETALGDQSNGWTLQLNPVIIVDGQLIGSIELKAPKGLRLKPLEDKFVQAKGKLTFIPGFQTEQRPVFELSSIKEHKYRKGLQP